MAVCSAAKPRFAVAGASAVLAVLSAVFFDVNVVGAVVHALLVLAVPLLLVRWPAAARWVALALLVLVVVETSLGRSELEFAAERCTSVERPRGSDWLS